MTRRHTAALLGLGLWLALGVAACGAPTGGQGEGSVESVDVEARKVTLDHGEVPGVMKAMTMTFDVAPGVPLAELEPGAEVEFRVEVEGGVYTVTEIRPVGSGAENQR